MFVGVGVGGSCLRRQSDNRATIDDNRATSFVYWTVPQITA